MIDTLHHEIRFVYGIKSLDLIKVGVAMNIEKRMEKMRLENPHGCELVFTEERSPPLSLKRGCTNS